MGEGNGQDLNAVISLPTIDKVFGMFRLPRLGLISNMVS